MDEETEFDGWSSLDARRQAEDEKLIQRYAGGEGRGLDVRPVRAFVQHVRRDLGPTAIICDVTMTVNGTGHEVVASYYFPGAENESPAAAPMQASVTDVPTRPTEHAAMPAAAGGSLTPVLQSATATPRSLARLPTAPAPARSGTGLDGVAAPRRAG